MFLSLSLPATVATLNFTYCQSQTTPIIVYFLRATAVPAGTAEARISYENYVCPSVCLSVRHDPVVYQAQVRQRLRVFTI